MPSKRGMLKEKTQDANFCLPIKNPNPLLKKTDSGFGFQKWLKIGRIPDPGFGLPTLFGISENLSSSVLSLKIPEIKLPRFIKKSLKLISNLPV